MDEKEKGNYEIFNGKKLDIFRPRGSGLSFVFCGNERIGYFTDDGEYAVEFEEHADHLLTNDELSDLAEYGNRLKARK